MLAGLNLAACGLERSEPGPTSPRPCSATWQQRVEGAIETGDAQGHGPDIGSAEWRSVVEFKLGIRDDPAVPAVDSDDWCGYIDEVMRTTGVFPR